jgi:polyhydroxybutyrate depolymerase
MRNHYTTYLIISPMFFRLLWFFILAACISESAFASFPDTSTSFYRDAIDTLASEKVISGFDDGTFGPEKTITRAEILKVYLRTKWVTLDATPKTRCFRDVPTTLWYHPYICEGKRLGIVQGFDNRTFWPDKPVTVLEALAMWLRLYGLAPANGNPWHLPYQEFANTNHILDTASYSITSPMIRGKASELILKIREYNTKKSPLTYLSKGCTSPKSLTSGTHEVTVAGKTRSYILTVPSSYSSANPAKLIVAIHGRTNSNTMVQGYMWLERQSEFIVAYPAGLPSGSAFSWSSDENITFVDTIIRDITDSHCVDKSSVHVVAHSLGASFASRLACTRGDTFRSMAIVWGGGYTSACGDTPTASLIFQRPDDRLSSPATARATESKMKLVNKCGSTTRPVTIWGKSCVQWNDCSTGNPVVWCENYSTYGNDPHSWPTGWGGMIMEWMKGL